MDRGIATSTPKEVRVRVQKDGKTIGSSSAPASTETEDTTAVEHHIRQARDSLFAEELFYELNREARGLLKHGVDLKRNLVQFPADHDQQILIDLVDLNLDGSWVITKESSPSPSFNECNGLANAVSQSLRILLSHAHRKNLRRRSQVPPPVTAKKPPTPEYIVLRPVFAYLQHRSHFRWLASFLDTLTQTLQSAGIHLQQRRFPFTSRPSTNAADLPAIESFVDSLLAPLESYITIPLCTPSYGLRVRVFTNMHPNGAGTQFDATTNHPALSHAIKTPLKLGLRDELGQFVTYLFTVDLVHFIADVSKRLYPSPPPPASSQQDTTTTTTTTTGEGEAGEPDEWEDGEDEDEKSVNPVAELLGITPTPLPRLSKTARAAQATIPLLPWELAFPEAGELTAFSPKKNRTRKMCVELSDAELALATHWMAGTGVENGKVGDEERYVWRADQPQAEQLLEGAVEAMGKADGKETEAEAEAEAEAKAET